MKPASRPPITLGRGEVLIRDEALFGLDGAEACRGFLARAFSAAEVRSVLVDRVARSASIRLGPGTPDLGRLASALRGDLSAGPIRVGTVPRLPRASSFSIHRLGSGLTTWEVVLDEPGRLRLRNRALVGDHDASDRVERAVLALPGVRAVKLSPWTGHLFARFDPAQLEVPTLIRAADEGLLESGPAGPGASSPTPVNFGLANLTLGVAAATEWLVPVLAPASAALLVGTNLRTFREARLQLGRKRLGLPVLYSAIVGTTLLTGQFVASALMTWTFRFWHRRFRTELATERGRLLERAPKPPASARLIVPNGAEVLVPIGRLRVGDRFLVESGESVPADGRVAEGEGVVDERAVRGLEGTSRKRPGDPILEGAIVLAGSMRVEVTRVGDQTRASEVRRALVAATSPEPGPLAPTARSEAFASKAVGPTLATAGVGLLAGDFLTAAAILRPDYATGPGLAVPLQTLHDVALCARLGIVARDPEALERLAEVDLFVLGDHPLLGRTELDLSRVESRVPEPVLLRYAAGAFRHLVDDRAPALLRACRERRIPILKLDPVDFDRGVTVLHGKHRIRVSDAAETPTGPAGPLAVEVDGTVVGRIEFATTRRLEAASAIDRIRRGTHTPFALVSGRPEAETATLAGALGVEMFRGNFPPDRVAEFLVACRDRGLKVAFVGDCRAMPRASGEAFVSISIVGGESDLESDPGALLMQQARLGPLADLLAISRAHATSVRQAQQLILVPNLLCVAGAFLFGFTGMTAVMLTNLGTLGLYRMASDPLRGLDPRPGRRPERPPTALVARSPSP